MVAATAGSAEDEGGGATAESTLAWLLTPLPVQTFLDDVWTVARHHVHRDDPDYFAGLVPPSTAELLECVRPDPSTLRLVRGEEQREADHYRAADGTLDVARVQQDFAAGYTIVINKLERYLRSVADLAHSLEVELNFPAQVNAYLTPPSATGFVPHYDPHDVMVLQIGGTKHWHLYGDAPVPAAFMARHEQLDVTGLPAPTVLRLAPGDVLYLPRGAPHAAATGPEASLHLTVGLHAPTLLTLLTHVVHALSLTDERLHERLPARYLDDPAVRAELGRRLAPTVEAVGEPAAIDAGLAALANIVSRRGRCPPVQPAAVTGDVDAETVLRRYQPLYARVIPLPDGVGLQFAQVLLRRGAEHEPALRFLAARTEPFRVRDVPGLSRGAQTHLVRSLLAAGFLVPEAQ
ncbi:cupin [Mycobacterium koreense]|uniref:Cupin n=1 Tax=Mycolicibacillus koreensis TaxID=1069220 RepID=A0A7I7SFM2_9MYCO|nr:cupin domain-containing protein [Mycolicibacillus koreensis]MCV7248370.1 cupin [Mycolicibacillus koreensis]OSC34317.1 cupin [Mycolicibacillus koreensis]BBY55310.1 hypothetical protein MKOR_25610 [Mycolicibacillus koreensis]